MENDLQVGDRVTYKNRLEDEIITIIVLGASDINKLKNGCREILKIERPKYEVVEEKKELLTEEERAYLIDIIENVNKYSCMKVNKISFRETNTDKLVINCFNNDYCIFEMVICEKFKNLNKLERYTLKDLGLEEN